MTLYLLDHAFVIFLSLVVPFLSYYSMRKFKAEIEAGRTEMRMRFFRRVMIEEWGALIVVTVYWFAIGRGASDLGLGLQGGGLAWGGYALATFICVLMAGQLMDGIRNAKSREKFRKKMESVVYLLPHTLEERRAFDFVSITAGVCEEVIFRGFVIAYFIALLGIPFWGAAVLSSIVFGLAHTYQGPIGFVRTAGVGLLLAQLYGMTGSIWASIIVHTLMDLGAGRMITAGNGPAKKSPNVIDRSEQTAA